jgi:hypothetical protein
VSNVSNLRPAWKPGQSGNPSGINVPKEAVAHLMEARKLCAENAKLAVAKLLQLMECGKPEVEKAAACEILDRGGLKAVALDVQSVETDESGNVRTLRVEFVKPDVK